MYVVPVVIAVLILAALIDLITRPDGQVQHLPKLTWVFIIVLLPLIGSIAWFAVGRDWGGHPEAVPFGDPRRQEEAVERISGLSAADRAALEADRRIAEKEARLRRLEQAVEAKREDPDRG